MQYQNVGEAPSKYGVASWQTSIDHGAQNILFFFGHDVRLDTVIRSPSHCEYLLVVVIENELSHVLHLYGGRGTPHV